MAKRKRATQVTRTRSRSAETNYYTLTLGGVHIFAPYSRRSRTWGVLISLGGWRNATHYGNGRAKTRMEAFRIARANLAPAVMPEDDPPVLRQLALFDAAPAATSGGGRAETV